MRLVHLQSGFHGPLPEQVRVGEAHQVRIYLKSHNLVCCICFIIKINLIKLYLIEPTRGVQQAQ